MTLTAGQGAVAAVREWQRRCQERRSDTMLGRLLLFKIAGGVIAHMTRHHGVVAAARGGNAGLRAGLLQTLMGFRGWRRVERRLWLGVKELV